MTDPVYKGNRIENLNKLTPFMRKTRPKTVQVTQLQKMRKKEKLKTPGTCHDLASRPKDHHHERHK